MVSGVYRLNMRILHVIPGLAWDCGASRQLCNISQELAKMGHQVDIAYFFGKLPEGMDLPSVNIHRIKAKSAYDPLIIWRFFSLLKFIKPDIIQTWFLQVDILGGIATRLSKTPWIIREPGSKLGYTVYWKNRLRFWLAKKADAVVVNSIAGKKFWSENSNVKCCKVIRNGIRWDAVKENLDISLMKTNTDENSKTVLYVGRLEKPKNLPVMLLAISKAMKDMPIKAILAGEGSERSKLEKQVRQAGIEDRVRFIGAIPNAKVLALMKQVDMMLLLSKWEGFPNAAVEAMGCSCPLVVSDIPEHREFLDERSALFADPDNVDEISNAIRNCLCHKSETKERAKVAGKLASQWTVEKAAREYEDLYRNIIH
jgi:glycosyltransferase involved in cell wall biosynthesis